MKTRYFLIAMLTFLPLITISNQVGAGTPVACDPEPTNMPIGYGDAISCSLTNSDTDDFSFIGTVGENILIRATRTSGTGGDPCIDLENPDGSSGGFVCGGFTSTLETTLTQSGTFSVRINSSFLSFSYVLVLERNTPASPTATAQSYTDQIDETLGYRGDPDYFTFEGTTGDLAFLRMTRTTGTGGDSCISL